MHYCDNLSLSLSLSLIPFFFYRVEQEQLGELNALEHARTLKGALHNRGRYHHYLQHPAEGIPSPPSWMNDSPALPITVENIDVNKILLDRRSTRSPNQLNTTEFTLIPTPEKWSLMKDDAAKNPLSENQKVDYDFRARNNE